MLTALLDSTSRPSFGVILDLIHCNSHYVDYKAGDDTSLDAVYKSGVSLLEINHAKPAITVWAVQLVAELVRDEGQKMICLENGLHLRASHKSGELLKQNHSKQATWDAVSMFSMADMQEKAESITPILWHIVSSYVNPTYGNDKQVVAVCQHRPQNIVNTLHCDNSLYAE
jgi:hypothetical protein